MSAHPVKSRGGDPVRARRLCLGEVVHYADDSTDWGVVAAFEPAGHRTGRLRAVVAWHNGDVGQYTLTGGPDGTSATPGRVWPTVLGTVGLWAIVRDAWRQRQRRRGTR